MTMGSADRIEVEAEAPTPSTPSPFQQASAPQEIQPPASDIAEHTKLRRREMATISNRLGRLSKMPWAKVWGSIAVILVGAAVGGAVAALQMGPKTNKAIYWGIVGTTCFIGVICAAAAYTTNDERADSVSAIKVDLDRLLADGDSRT